MVIEKRSSTAVLEFALELELQAKHEYAGQFVGLEHLRSSTTEFSSVELVAVNVKSEGRVYSTRYHIATRLPQLSFSIVRQL